jgi:hypothetical protein
MPIQFSFYNQADAATLSAGSWQAGAPLANLQQEFLSLRARSTNADAASTQFRADLGNANTVVRLVALARHNLTVDATYRITAGTTAGASDLYDSGTLPAWPAVYLPTDLEWEDDNWWTGQITAAEAEGYPIGLAHDCGANIRARYWTLYFTDTSNPATYVELARLWLGPLWSPQRNYANGSQFGWESRDVHAYSLGGVMFSERRAPARVLRVALNGLKASEAYGAILDAQRRLGTTGQLWVIPAPNDAARAIKRNFMAHFRKIDPITHAFAPVHEHAMELEEIL